MWALDIDSTVKKKLHCLRLVRLELVILWKCWGWSWESRIVFCITSKSSCLRAQNRHQPSTEIGQEQRGIERTRAEASGTAPLQPCRSPCSGMTWLAVSDQVKDHHQPGGIKLYLASWRSSSKMPEQSPNEKADHSNHFRSGLPHSVTGLLTSRPQFFSTAFTLQHI